MLKLKIKGISVLKRACGSPTKENVTKRKPDGAADPKRARGSAFESAAEAHLCDRAVLLVCTMNDRIVNIIACPVRGW